MNSKISIIIVNYNGKHLLKECFKSLQNIIYDNYEVIVVDNNSTDESIEFLETQYPSTIILKLEKNFGFAYPNNMGAKIANGEFLLFLNNDTIVKPDTLNELVNVFHNDPQIGIAQSLLLHQDGEVDSSGDFIDKNGVSFSSHERSVQVKEILSAKAAAMMIKKDLYFQLNGFDEKFYATFEDVDLGWRCWILGHKVVLAPSSIVYHKGGETINKIRVLISFHGYKNQLVMRLTNFETRRATISTVNSFVIYGIKLVRTWFDYKIKGKTFMTVSKHEDKLLQKPNWKIIFKSMIWIMRNYNYINKKRHQIAISRVYTTKVLEEKHLII